MHGEMPMCLHVDHDHHNRSQGSLEARPAGWAWSREVGLEVAGSTMVLQLVPLLSNQVKLPVLMRARQYGVQFATKECHDFSQGVQILLKTLTNKLPFLLADETHLALNLVNQSLNNLVLFILSF
jgi:hypothetical protein